MLIIFYDDGISEIADTAFDTAFVQIDRSLATPLQLNLNQAVLLSFQDKVECAGVFSVFFFVFFSWGLYIPYREMQAVIIQFAL